MTKPRDLTGRVYGRLRVVSLSPLTGRRKWRCVCDCGLTKAIGQADLLRGDAASCGCLQREVLIARNKARGVDVGALAVGEFRAYIKWRSMRRRVANPTGKSTCYLGVRVCKRWGDFYKFLDDMGVPPTGYSLERTSNKKGYSPANCTWVPLAAQAQNTSRARRVRFRGETLCLSEHARRQGLAPDIVFDRLNKLGWKVAKALTTAKRHLTKQTFTDWRIT